MSRRHPAALLTAAVTGVLALAGCGGSGPSTAGRSTAGPSPTTASTSPPFMFPSDPPTVAASSSPVASATPTGFVFPVKARTSFGTVHHDYPATDIFAPCGSTVVAPTDGVINAVSLKDTWDPKVNSGATRGGLSWSLVTMDGVRFYGSHLRSIAAGINPGVTVHRGEVIGQVGKTGDAAHVHCHLHFGISPACGTDDWWTRRGVISPYPYLKAWQDGDNLSPAKAVAAWKKSHGCTTSPPKNLADG